VTEPAGKPAPAAAPAAPPARPSTVVVAEGETLASIARRWGTTVPAIMMANNLVNEKVTPGKKLKLPPATKPGPRVSITIGG
jgi:LysM repeat protein